MEFVPKLLSRSESDLLAGRFQAHFRRHGSGLCAATFPEHGGFTGFAGLATSDFTAHFTPCVEIGWRLGADYRGRGLAAKGARAMAREGFEPAGLMEPVSFTAPANVRSIRVMQKLGLTRSPDDDFDHPKLREGHPLRRHVLYRLRRTAHAP